MENYMQRANEIMQECQIQGDWKNSNKAAILLYTYADRLIQLSLQQKKEQEKREKEKEEQR